MTDKDAVLILMHLLRCGRVSTWTTNEDAYRMVLEEFNLSFKEGRRMNAYQDGYQEAVNRACEYLDGFLDYSELIEYQVSEEKHEDVIKDFRKFMFMEEQ